MPEISTALVHSFGPLAQLRGSTTHLDKATGILTVTLVWEVLAETATSYRVFIHLLDENGAILTQADGEPASWARPTTGWLPGEFIIDNHQLSWPTEIGPNAQLAIGLYDSASGIRLSVDEGEHGER